MQRHIPLAGQPNFRDLGGYRSRDGRQVKWGVIYRSGELSQLSDEDVDKLGELRIKAVVDLRSEQEVTARGQGRLPPSAALWPMPISSSEVFADLIPVFMNGDFSKLPTDLLDRVNRALVRDFTTEFGGLLRTLSDPSNRPLVFHCTQGKDRAGFGAAMVLSALGVPWETVVHDYMLSNHFREQENQKMLGMVRRFASQGGEEAEEMALRRVEGLMFVNERSLGAAHAEIIERHGSVEAFVVDGLGLSLDGLERLREDLLE